jgi:hypothetical protein
VTPRAQAAREVDAGALSSLRIGAVVRESPR